MARSISLEGHPKKGQRDETANAEVEAAVRALLGDDDKNLMSPEEARMRIDRQRAKRAMAASRRKRERTAAA